MSESSKEFFQYKGYPLVRQGGMIYYGNMSDEFVVMLQILSTKKVGNIDVADKIRLFRISTDDNLSATEKITKVATKESLYEALDIANAWLSRAAG